MSAPWPPPDVRSVATRTGITPGVRARVLAEFDHRCVSCGRAATDGVTLHLDHLVSRSEAAVIGALDALIDSEWNLAPMCEECNLGKRDHCAEFISLIYRVLLVKERSHALRKTA